MMRRTAAPRSPSSKPTLSQPPASAGGAKRSRKSTTAATVSMTALRSSEYRFGTTSRRRSLAPLDHAEQVGEIVGPGRHPGPGTERSPAQVAGQLAEVFLATGHQHPLRGHLPLPL